LMAEPAVLFGEEKQPFSTKPGPGWNLPLRRCIIFIVGLRIRTHVV
jgi:hypothetical protein